jgi:BTB And C-terminal Kelch
MFLFQTCSFQAVEEEVFEAVMRWFQHRAEERSRYIYDVLQFIRFWLIDEHYLYDRVKPCVLLQSEPRVQTILDEVVHYKLLKNRWMETDLYMEPRYGAEFCRQNIPYNF